MKKIPGPNLEKVKKIETKEKKQLSYIIKSVGLKNWLSVEIWARWHSG